MMDFRKMILATILAVNFLAIFPTAAQCETSYYEKYYSAKKYVPVKRSLPLEYNFTVTLHPEEVKSFETVALVGNLKVLGSWQTEGAILLNRTTDYITWTGTVYLPPNASVSYRYFIAAVEPTSKTIQIKRWESDLEAREFKVSSEGGKREDKFGYIQEDRKEVSRGWLSSGKIVQFQLFRNPLNITDGFAESGKRKIRIKIQPVEPKYLSPITSSARAHVEYVRFSYGGSFLRDQSEFGVPFEESDKLIFHITVHELENVAFTLQIYDSQEATSLVRLIGYQHIYSNSLEGTEGNFSVSIISPVWLSSIGSLDLKYLVIAPLEGNLVDFRTSFVDYWRGNWTGFEMGHRGLGKSLKESAANAAPLLENTIGTMKAAGQRGADFVEFDVQLTKDLIPIIYHDYSIYVCIESKTPTSKDDLTQVLIKDVTYEQLKDLKTYQVVAGKVVEYPSHNSVENEDNRLFPLFEDFLTKVNKSVGFDIEIKWPQQLITGAFESSQTIDKNVYIDRILSVMMEHGCGRMSFFTSFDADICSLLRFKQNMYPVMFLFSSKESVYADPRSDTFYDTVNTAQAFDLVGIVPNAVWILDTKWVEVAHKQNKKIVLWGGSIKDRDSIDWYKSQGVDGVIYDRMDLHLPERSNAFELEDDLPEFFNKQCKPSNESNETAFW